MPEHELKVWPGPYIDLLEGRKRAEFRRDDRGFKVGDILRLMEWSPVNEKYTGRRMFMEVTHVQNGGQFGIPTGYVMLSVTHPAAVPHVFYT